MQQRSSSRRWRSPYEQYGEPTDWAKDDAGTKHTIRGGETLMSIMVSYYHPTQYEPSWWRAIVKANPDVLEDTLDLTQGEVIVIPPRPRSTMPGESTS
jgi:nucleoid-associated protein YgaU